MDTNALLAATQPTPPNQFVHTMTPSQESMDKVLLRNQILSQLGAGYFINARRPMNFNGTSLVLSNVGITDQSSSPFGLTPQGVLDSDRNSNSFDFGLIEFGKVQNEANEFPSCAENFAQRGYSLPTSLFK